MSLSQSRLTSLPNNEGRIGCGIKWLTMNETKLTLLNTSILTSFGTFSYSPLTLDEARQIIRDFQQEGRTIESAIGHKSTADLLTMLLHFPVAVNRTEFKQNVTDAALVFKIKGRPPEGRVLSREELEEMGYEFGFLRRVA